MTEVLGVYPLVCVSCRYVVGAINAAAFFRAMQDEDAYICRECLADPTTEERLATVDNGEWGYLTVAAIINPRCLPIREVTGGCA